MGDVRFGRCKPPKKLKFCRIQYLSWHNRVTVGINSNRNRLPLGTVLYSDNRQQLITTMSTSEHLQRDRATPKMNCWNNMRRFNVTRKGAARSLWAYIAVCSQTHCNRLVAYVFLCLLGGLVAISRNATLIIYKSFIHHEMVAQKTETDIYNNNTPSFPS